MNILSTRDLATAIHRLQIEIEKSQGERRDRREAWKNRSLAGRINDLDLQLKASLDGIDTADHSRVKESNKISTGVPEAERKI
jgi:hypothetical protein